MVLQDLTSYTNIYMSVSLHPTDAHARRCGALLRSSQIHLHRTVNVEQSFFWILESKIRRLTFTAACIRNKNKLLNSKSSVQKQIHPLKSKMPSAEAKDIHPNNRPKIYNTNKLKRRKSDVDFPRTAPNTRTLLTSRRLSSGTRWIHLRRIFRRERISV